MIISRTPLRITIGGGGTDLPSFYTKHGGFVISMAINKYIYITLKPDEFEKYLKLRYSQIEIVDDVTELKNHRAKELLLFHGIHNSIEIDTCADLPSNTGLGSSGTFLVGLSNIVREHKRINREPSVLAEEACYIEIDRLNEPVGKQDQYIAAFGGLKILDIDKTGIVTVKEVNIKYSDLKLFLSHIHLYYTNVKRDASEILLDQKQLKGNSEETLLKVKEQAYKVLDILETGNFREYGLLLDDYWKLKKTLSNKISISEIDIIYDEVKSKFGVLGGKVCFVSTTHIKTENGFKYIKDINVNEKVYDHQNNIQKVLHVIKRNYVGKMLKLTVNGLKDVIIVTPEHPFFTTYKDKNNKRELNDSGKKQSIINRSIFKEAKTLKKGECLLIPVNTEVIDVEKIEIKKDIKQSIYSKYDIYKGIPEEIKIDYDFLNMLGWFIAEGSANNKQFHFTMNINELDDAIIIVNNIKNIFKKTVTIKKNISSNSLTIVGSSVVITDLLNKLCGKYAENKHIPSFIMNLPIDKQAILLSALWKGDGCERNFFDKRNNKSYTRCCYKTVSFKLAKQVQELCFRFGFICSIKEKKEHTRLISKNKKESFCQIVYTIEICGEDAIEFKKFIETGKLTKINRRNKKGLSLSKDFVKIDGVTYAKRSIIKIEEFDYDGEVFNLNVENSHTYIANDVSVHNCGAGGGGFLMLFTEKNHSDVENYMETNGYKRLHFDIDKMGSTILGNFD